MRWSRRSFLRTSLAGASGLFTPGGVDLALADTHLEIALAEHDRGHFVHRNPAIWTGEAIFGVLSLVTRDFAPLAERLDHADGAAHGALRRSLLDPLLALGRGALDVGTGDGAFLGQLLANGFTDVAGVEPSAAPVAMAAPEVRGALLAQGAQPSGSSPEDLRAFLQDEAKKWARVIQSSGARAD